VYRAWQSGNRPALRLIEAGVDHDRLPRILSIQHDPKLAVISYYFPSLLDYGALVWRVMDYAEGIDQIKALPQNHRRQVLGVGGVECPVEAEDVEPSAGQGEADLGEFNGCVIGAGPGEIDRIGADAATDLQHPFTGPALEPGKPGNVRFDEIFAFFDIVEIFPGTNLSGRMADVAWSAIPVRLNCRNIDIPLR
jgi:hypothetical protein